MCQSRAQGGRRCAAHMAVTRASKRIAMQISSMRSEQIDSLFSQLRAEGKGMESPSDVELMAHLRILSSISNSAGFDQKGRSSIRNILDSSLEEHVPDGATFYAVKNLHRYAHAQAKSLRDQIVEIADDLGVSKNVAMQQFWDHYEQYKTSSRAVPTGYKSTNTLGVIAGVPTDNGTQKALEILKTSAARARLASPRVRRFSLEESPIAEVGYAEIGGRLEFVMHNSPDVVRAYHSVPSHLWEQAQRFGYYNDLHHQVESNPRYAYSSAREAQNDAQLNRCGDCGRFTNLHHICPAREPAIVPLEEMYSTPLAQRSHVVDTKSLSNDYVISSSSDEALPEAFSEIFPSEGRNHMLITGLNHLPEIVNNGDVATVRVVAGVSHDSRNSIEGFSLTVNAEVYRDNSGWNTAINGFECNCDNYYSNSHCKHVVSAKDISTEKLGKAIRDFADPTGETPLKREKSTVYLQAEGRVNGRRASPYPEDRLNVSASRPEDITGFPHSNSDRVDIAPLEKIKENLHHSKVCLKVEWSGTRSTFSVDNNYYDDYYDGASGYFGVRGSIVVSRDGEMVSAHRRDLACACEQYQKNYHCVHIDYVSNQLLYALGDDSSNQKIGHFNEIADVIQKKKRQENWGADSEYAQQMMLRHANVSVEDSYSLTPESFNQDVQEALEKSARGEESIEYVTENALGEEGQGRQFGVELEFDFSSDTPSYRRSNALNAIAQELHAEGLTSSAFQQDYHAAQHNGYDRWSFEKDATVSGEIVSPIMTDNPEHWEQLRKVCEIVKKHGGIASFRAGSHVHVSTGSYGNDVEKHGELASIINQHEDTLYRLSSNPDTGHRPMEWCAPNETHNEISFKKITRNNLKALGEGHGLGINFQSATGKNPQKDNVEFRQWDATLDPAIIQTQILLSVATVNAAERNVASHGMSKIMREPLGSHFNRNLEGQQDSSQESATTRNYIDTIFSSREHKKKVAALYAMTSWQSADYNYDNGDYEAYYDDYDYDEDDYYDEDDDEPEWDDDIS